MMITAFILIFAIPATSQMTTSVEIAKVPIKVGAMGDTEDVVQWKYLAKHRGIDSKEKLRAVVRDNLVRAKKIDEFQRVEVAGVASIDDTNEAYPGMIDKPVKTSNLYDVLPTRNRLKDAWNSISAVVGKDLRESLSDTRGIPSERSEKIISQLKGARINELFAHSWGTEVVYLGILNGDIPPPKTLIIMGVPEDNEEKWLMLAKYTGIEVHVVGFEWDKPKIAGNIATMLKSGLPQDTAGLKKLWGANCAKRAQRGCVDPEQFVRTKFDYNVHIRPPTVPKDKFIKGTLSELDHDRLIYFAYLSNRNLFNKTLEQLEAPQLELIKDEETKILNEALSTARSLISQAHEQVKIAHRDHDERLRNTKAAMAARSCANPGSVTQAELNALPEPYDENLVFTPPQGLDACSYSVYMRLGRGVDAEEIRSASEPNILARPDPPADIPSVVRPADIPSVVRPIDNPPLANSSPRFMFSSFFPNLKDLAVKACLSPANASLKPNAIPPFSEISFAGDFDDQRAASLSAGMAECPRQLFYKLIEMIRSDKGTEIDNQWLRNMASLYSAPVYVPRPWSGGDPCRDNGNIRCP